MEKKEKFPKSKAMCGERKKVPECLQRGERPVTTTKKVALARNGAGGGK